MFARFYGHRIQYCAQIQHTMPDDSRLDGAFFMTDNDKVPCIQEANTGTKKSGWQVAWFRSRRINLTQQDVSATCKDINLRHISRRVAALPQYRRISNISHVQWTLLKLLFIT